MEGTERLSVPPYICAYVHLAASGTVSIRKQRPYRNDLEA